MRHGKDVVFRQGCSDDELVAAYQQALCVVLPSVYRTIYGVETLVPELLGQTLLEGMACGIPGVCTDVASMPEINKDGETGFVVPPYNVPALTQALTHCAMILNWPSEWGVTRLTMCGAISPGRGSWSFVWSSMRRCSTATES